MTGLLSDLRSAVRSLAASRGVVVIAVTTLGAGLALCLTVLAAVNAYIVRALPYPEADRVHRIDYAAPNQEGPDYRALLALDWRAVDDVIEVPMAWDLDVFYLLGARSADGSAICHSPVNRPRGRVGDGCIEFPRVIRRAGVDPRPYFPWGGRRRAWARARARGSPGRRPRASWRGRPQ